MQAENIPICCRHKHAPQSKFQKSLASDRKAYIPCKQKADEGPKQGVTKFEIVPRDSHAGVLMFYDGRDKQNGMTRRTQTLSFN